MIRWGLAVLGAAVVTASCAAHGDGTAADGPAATVPTTMTSATSTSSTSTTTSPVVTGDGLAFDEGVDLRGFAMAADHSGTGFIAIADHTDAGPVIWLSDDGLDWQSSALEHNLPAGVRGPYRLWRLGERYLLYAVIETRGNLLGEEPLIALSDDAATWRDIDTPGIDEFFWQNDWTPPEPGGVTAGGTVALFTGIDSHPDGTPNAVIYRLRANVEGAELIENPLPTRHSVAVTDAVLGGSWMKPGTYAIARFDGSEWSLSTEFEAAVDLRVIGDRVLALAPDHTRYSDDGGVTWTDGPGLPSDIRQFAWFGEHGAAGEVRPAFGTPESFPMSRDGLVWWEHALPDGVVDIRHLMTTEHGLFSVVRYTGEGERAVIFTEF